MNQKRWDHAEGAVLGGPSRTGAASHLIGGAVRLMVIISRVLLNAKGLVLLEIAR